MHCLIRSTAFVIYIKDYHIAVSGNPTIPDLKCSFGMTSGGFMTDLYCVVEFLETFQIATELCCRVWHYPCQRTIIIPNKLFELSDYRRYHLVKISIAPRQKFNVLFLQKQTMNQYFSLLSSIRIVLYNAMAKKLTA